MKVPIGLYQFAVEATKRISVIRHDRVTLISGSFQCANGEMVKEIITCLRRLMFYLFIGRESNITHKILWHNFTPRIGIASTRPLRAGRPEEYKTLRLP
jgi:hypothetical protein